MISCSINSTKGARDLSVAMDGILTYEGIYMELPLKELTRFMRLTDKQETGAWCIKPVDEPT
jgi:hypothetical protein